MLSYVKQYKASISSWKSQHGNEQSGELHQRWQLEISKRLLDDIKKDGSVEYLTAMVYLLRRSWWSRTWILKEVVLASRALAICGSILLSWMELECATRSLLPDWGPIILSLEEKDRHKDDTYYINCAVGIEYLRRQKEEGIELSLLRVLYATRSTLCADPRDKVYGVMGLAADATARGAKANYAKSYIIIYKEAAIILFSLCSTLDALCFAGYPRNMLRLPSWCRDWRVIEGG